MSQKNALIQRALGILELLAQKGMLPARVISADLDIPVPTVYRLLSTLASSGYVATIRQTGQYELGPKCCELGMAFQSQLAVPQSIRKVVDELHRTVGMAAYFATFRGAEIILTYCSDCVEHPRLRPLHFGFHEAAHATAFGKILLASMDPSQRESYLEARGLPRMTAATITDVGALESHLAEVSARGIAWEFDEFIPEQTCAAVPVRNGAGMVVGAVAISHPSNARSRRQSIGHELNTYASLCSQYFRGGQYR